jgi:hypothetical protein
MIERNLKRKKINKMGTNSNQGENDVAHTQQFFSHHNPTLSNSTLKQKRMEREKMRDECVISEKRGDERKHFGEIERMKIMGFNFFVYLQQPDS